MLKVVYNITYLGGNCYVQDIFPLQQPSMIGPSTCYIAFRTSMQGHLRAWPPKSSTLGKSWLFNKSPDVSQNQLQNIEKQLQRARLYKHGTTIMTSYGHHFTNFFTLFPPYSSTGLNVGVNIYFVGLFPYIEAWPPPDLSSIRCIQVQRSTSVETTSS